MSTTPTVIASLLLAELYDLTNEEKAPSSFPRDAAGHSHTLQFVHEVYDSPNEVPEQEEGMKWGGINLQ